MSIDVPGVEGFETKHSFIQSSETNSLELLITDVGLDASRYQIELSSDLPRETTAIPWNVKLLGIVEFSGRDNGRWYGLKSPTLRIDQPETQSINVIVNESGQATLVTTSE
jgi:hypothetical protein